MTPTQMAALIGAVTGPLGLLISVLTYLRDRPRLWVSMAADMRIHNSEKYDPEKVFLVATVSNVGRRPEYVELVALLHPDGQCGMVNDVFFNPNEVQEGKPPAKYLVEQDLITGLEQQWPGILALVRTSSGRQYRSRFLHSPPRSCPAIGFIPKFRLRLSTRRKHPWAFRRRFLS